MTSKTPDFIKIRPTESLTEAIAELRQVFEVSSNSDAIRKAIFLTNELMKAQGPSRSLTLLVDGEEKKLIIA